MPYVEWNGTRYEFRGTYHDRHIPKQAGWLWDAKTKVWWTKLPDYAQRLAKYAKGAAKERLVDSQAQREASRATDADIDVPAPENCEYMAFQRAGVAYCLRTQSGNALIADDMGLGKTVQAIGVVNAKPDIRTVMVVCPASVKIVWQRHFRDWCVRPVDVRLWENKDTVATYDPKPDHVLVHIANWDILHQRGRRKEGDKTVAKPCWRDLHPDVLILDESHKMKSEGALRTKAAIEIAENAGRILSLTGTPVVNRPIELWTTAHLLDPETWGSRSFYSRRYCDGHMEQHSRFGKHWEEKGASNLSELQDRLRSSIMVRRRKQDVLTELPPKRRTVVELDSAKYSSVLAREESVVGATRASAAQLKARLQKLDSERNAEEYKAAARSLRELYTVAFTELSQVRHETALAKVQDVSAWTEDALENEDKVLVFAHHQDVIAALAQLLSKYGVVTLTGADSQSARQETIDTFQTDPDTRVFIGSTLAAGIGITLTEASTVIFAELDWAPSNLTQAEDRAYRIGQMDAVSVYHLVVDGSLDAKMANMLVAKQEIIDAALDDITQDLDVRPYEVIELEPEPEDIFQFTAGELGFLHSLIRQLSASCDGAVMQDGQGFNKSHARMGHSLAAEDALTHKQAATAVRLANFYHGQFDEPTQADIATVYQRWANYTEGETE